MLMLLQLSLTFAKTSARVRAVVAVAEFFLTDCHPKLTKFVNYSYFLCRTTDLNSAKDTNEPLAEAQEPALL